MLGVTFQAIWEITDTLMLMRTYSSLCVMGVPSYARLCLSMRECAYTCANRRGVTDIMAVTDVQAFKLLTLWQLLTLLQLLTF